MYADRHQHSSGPDPRSLGIAVAINAGVVAALMLSHPTLTIIKPPRPPLVVTEVPVQPIPPENPPPPKTPDHPLTQPRVVVPHPPIDTPTDLPPIATTEIVPLTPPPPVDLGRAAVPDSTPTPALVTMPAEIDPAHRGDLQPVYPADELRAEREGVVTVRVLIGVDGRVRQVDRVAATSDAFFRATEERALARWRFRPATRGGVPIETWRQMTIRFVIPR